VAPETRAYTTELSRELDLYHLTMRGLGVMIGAGVFFGIGTSIATAGPGGLLLTFALNGLLALLTAMSYAELSSAAPYAGGAYDFARLAFGRRLGFLAGWAELMAACAASAMYATTLSLYAVHYLGALGLLRWLPAFAVVPTERLIAAIVAGLFIAVHWIGAEGTGRGSARVAVSVLLFFGLVGVMGLIATIKDVSRLSWVGSFLPFGWSPLPVAMGLTFVAFEGFEVIAQAGDEAKRPRKNLPKAMLYAVLVATTAYMVVAAASVVGAGPGGGKAAAWQWVASYGPTAFGEVASRLLPGGWLLPTLAVVVACALALNATVASAARSAYALGRDRMLPSVLSSLSRRGGTPYMALVATGCLVVPATLFVPITDLAAGASIMFLLVFTIVNLATIRARFERGHELHYGFVTPAFPLPQIIAVIAHIALALALARVSRIAWLLPQVWVLSGLVIYHLYGRQRALPLPDEGLVLEETGATVPAGKANELMIAISSPENALSLVGGAARLCGEEDCRMQLLHMVPAPAPVSLSDAKAYMKEGKEGLIEAMLYLYSRYPVATTVRYCRNIARGIVTAVRERKVRTLILGWHGHSRDQKFHMGSTLDPVLSRAPCDVIVLKDCADRVFRNILVAVLGGPSDVLALRTAVLLAESEGGRIKALLPKRWGSKKKIRQKFDQLLERTDLHTVEVRTQVATVPDMPRAVIRRAPRYDLVVLGVREPLVPSFGAPLSVAEAIARRCRRPMVIAKAHRRLPAWTRWWA
jgi:basic amino acid/polyamine antiporter, APA family